MDGAYTIGKFVPMYVYILPVMIHPSWVEVEKLGVSQIWKIRISEFNDPLPPLNGAMEYHRGGFS